MAERKYESRPNNVKSIVSIFKDIDIEALIQYLSSKEIYISAAHSACAENNDYRVLNAYGVPDIDAQKAVRISLGPYTTNKEIEELAKAIIEFYNIYVWL